MNCRQEGIRVFRVSGGNSTPLFQIKKRILNQVPCLINLPIKISGYFSVFLRRDHSIHPLFSSLSNNLIRVIGSIRQEMFGGKSLNQGDCLRTICSCTFCNNSPERHTMRIHGQMQFCVEPPFVRLII